jgi:predicted ester cyclase
MNAVDTFKTFMTALQSGDMDLASNTSTEDLQVSGLTPSPLNKPLFLAVQSELLAGFPDFSYHISDVHQEGDHVKALTQISGTHTKDLALPMFGIRRLRAAGLFVLLPQVETEFRVINEKVSVVQFATVPGGGFSGLLQQVGAELPVTPHRHIPEE